MTPLGWFAAGMCSAIMAQQIEMLALAWRRERFYRNFVRRRDIDRHAERYRIRGELLALADAIDVQQERANTDLADYNNLCFQYFWKLICKTDEREPHCLRYGCSSKTLSCWVYVACGIRIPPSILKRTLLIAVERGMATTSRSSCNFRCFDLIAPHRERQDQRERYQEALHRHFLAKTVRNEPLSAHASEELRELARSLDLSQAEVDDIHQYTLESSERWGSAYA